MSDHRSRLNASLEGRYRIERKLGEGGMATVWLADDLKHQRRVAIKVLRPELAAVVGAERFLSEIRTTANLEDPHILPLYDSGEADGFLFYVMPYVDGDSLRDRLDRERQLPADEAVDIVRKVASALQYAHDQGVVHRDIKPANILLRRDEPLVADFGIALALTQAGDGRITETGLSLGTPHYMSPEQAAGERSLDPRSDVYALGCVLYEMLTGESPHAGPTAQSILARILTDTPKRVTETRRTVAPNVDAAVAKALEKLPADRFASARAFQDALEDPTFRHEPARDAIRHGRGVHGPGGSAPRGSRGSRLWTAAAVVFGATTVLLAAALGTSWRPDDRTEPVLRFQLALDEDQQVVTPPYGRSLALSPDGSRLLYSGASPAGPWQLWIRSADALRATPVPNTDGIFTPVLSPDGSRVAFSGPTGNLHVAEVEGGAGRILTDSAGVVIDWTEGGWIYYQRGVSWADVLRIPEGGGEPVRVPVRGPAGPSAAWGFGQVLPGDEQMLMTRFDPEVGGIVLALDLATGEITEIVQGSDPTYLASGHLVWGTSDGALMVAPFDVDRMEVAGPPEQIATGVLTNSIGEVQYDISEAGSLVYRTGGAGGAAATLGWVDREGAVTSASDVELRLSIGLWDAVALSPDGQRAAFTIADQGASHIWIQDVARRTPPVRVTFEGSLNVRPAWNPGGDSITYITNAAGLDVPTQLWMRPSDGSGVPVPLVVSEREVEEGLVSPDGEWLVYRLGGTTTDRDIYARRREDGVERSLAATAADERSVTVSSDGRWVAYVSDEAGPDEVFVRPFPEVEGGRWQVSSGGGLGPAWAPGDSALHFVGMRNQLVRAEYRAPEGAFQVARVEPLFSAEPFFVAPNNTTYAVAPGGDRLLMIVVGGREEGLVWVENWMSELEASR